MPLIILGLIVVLGGCLLIYYQLGPKVTLRLKSGFGGMGGADAGGADAGAGADGAQGAPGDAGGADAKGGAASPGSGDAGGKAGADEGEKVLYVFGDGEREERPLRGSGDESPGGGDRDE